MIVEKQSKKNNTIPKVSVTVVTYNQENYIEQALESIVAQKVNFPYEIIIADDASTDKTLDICKKYASKFPNVITIVPEEENMGTTKNHLRACKMASGEYICNLEGDDYWCDEYKLQKQVDFLESHKNYFGVSHRILCYKDEKNNFPDIKRRQCGKITLKKFAKGKGYSNTATLYKNIYKGDITVFEELYTHQRILGDLTMCLYLLSLGDIYVLSDIMFVYRIESNNKNYNNTVKRREKSENLLDLTLLMYDYFNRPRYYYSLFVSPLMQLYFLKLKNKDEYAYQENIDKMPNEIRRYFRSRLPINLISYYFKYLKWRRYKK